MVANTCERCRSRPGRPYSFHYGRVGAVDVSGWSAVGPGNLQRTVTSQHVLGGVDTAFVCDSCLTHARLRRAGKVMVREATGFPLLLLGYALPVLWLGVTLWNGEWARAALWLLVVVGVPLLAFGLFFAFLPRESTGEWAAIELHRPALEEQGWHEFWMTRDYDRIYPGRGV